MIVLDSVGEKDLYERRVGMPVTRLMASRGEMGKTSKDKASFRVRTIGQEALVGHLMFVQKCFEKQVTEAKMMQNWWLLLMIKLAIEVLCSLMILSWLKQLRVDFCQQQHAMNEFGQHTPSFPFCRRFPPNPGAGLPPAVCVNMITGIAEIYEWANTLFVRSELYQ